MGAVGAGFLQGRRGEAGFSLGRSSQDLMGALGEPVGVKSGIADLRDRHPPRGYGFRFVLPTSFPVLGFPYTLWN